MRILFVVDSLGGGGAQRQLKNIAVGFKRLGHDVSVFTYHPLYDFRDELVSENVTLIESIKKSKFDLSPVISLYRTIKSNRPDTVVAFLHTPSLYAELVRRIHPNFHLIVSERNSTENSTLSTTQKFYGFMHFLADRIVINNYDYKNKLGKQFPRLRKKTSIIYNGVEEKYFKRYKKDRFNKALDKHNLKLIVVAARCTHQKGASVLLDALKILVETGLTDISIDWVGYVDFDSEYVQLINKRLEEEHLKKHWNWLGKSNRISEILGEYDGLVLSSLYEGVPNTVCEAMAIGLPVVASDVSDITYILNSGEHGLIFPKNDSHSLAACLQTLSKMPASERNQMAARAHQRATELFSETRLISEWESLCQEPTH